MRYVVSSFLFWAFLLLSGLGAVGCGKPSSPKSPSLLSVGPRVHLATWNVANFFDALDDPGRDTVVTPEQFQIKTREVALVLRHLDADFVALVEVENLHCLKSVNRALEFCYPQIGLLEGNDERGIDVAFLSRLPVERVISHKGRELPDLPGVGKGHRFSRDCLEVRLATEPPLTVFINHFKSQLGSKKDSAAKRRAQAQAVLEIVWERRRDLPEGFEVVMGDLNDRPGSWSLQPLENHFYDAFAGWPEDLRGTHRSKAGRGGLDHILVCRNLSVESLEPKVWRDLGSPTSDHDPISLVMAVESRGATVPVSKVWGE